MLPKIRLSIFHHRDPEIDTLRERKFLCVLRVLRGKRDDCFMDTRESSRTGMRRDRREGPRGREGGQRSNQSRQKEVFSDDSDENTAFNGAELSESVLGRDWNSPEEDAAWSNL